MSRVTLNTTRRLLLNTFASSRIKAKCKYSCLSFRVINISSRNNCPFTNIHKHSKIIGISCVRHQSTIDKTTPETALNTLKDAPTPQNLNATGSTNNIATEEVFISKIPDAPIPPSQEIAEAIVTLQPNGEPTFNSIGLGGYSPVGLIQYGLEWLHVHSDIPWWSEIIITTICIRILLFPLTVALRKHTARLRNAAGEMGKLQQQIQEAKHAGNEYDVALYTKELMDLMKAKEVSYPKMIALLVSQAPVFISMVIALNGMAKAPVESLKLGGLWWCPDLTIHDPYYILPGVTCLGMYCVIEYALTHNIQQEGLLKYVYRFGPLLLLPFLVKSPAIILCYMISTNCVTITQVALLENDKIKTFLKIPLTEVQPATVKRSFQSEISKSYGDYVSTRKLREHERAKLLNFNAAAQGPLKKTFKFNPTKQRPNKAQVLTKKQ